MKNLIFTQLLIVLLLSSCLVGKRYTRPEMKVPENYINSDTAIALTDSFPSAGKQDTTVNLQWFELSEKLQVAVLQEKGLHPNMDFYAATLYYALGVPVDMFTTMFACSRMAGWTAQIIEQYELNRLIRPSGQYAGALNREYVPIGVRDQMHDTGSFEGQGS